MSNAKGFDKPLGDHCQSTPEGLGSEEHPVGLGVLEAWDYLCLGVIPRNAFILAGASGTGAAHGPGYPVGVIKGLDSSLASYAELASAQRMVGVTLDLLGSAFHDPDYVAAACGALSACAGVPVIGPGDEVLGEVYRAFDEVLFRIEATGLEYDRAQ